MDARRDDGPPFGGLTWRPRFLLAAVVAALALAACDRSTTEPGALNAVVIDRNVDSTLFVNASADLRAFAVDAAGLEIASLTRRIEWESSNTDVASVNAQTGVVTAKAPGTASITAAVAGQASSILFRVSNAVGTIEVALDAGDRVRVGEDLQVCAVVRSTDGDVIPDQEVTWTVNDGSIASTAPPTGSCTTLHGVTKGEVEVTAETEGKQGSAEVRVVARVAQVELTEITGRVTAGDCAPLTAVALDEDDEPVESEITFESSDTDVATVNASGRVCWEAAGSVTITAESEGAKDSFEVTADPVPLTVVGVADLASRVLRAFKWTEAGGMEQLPALPGTASATAKGANDNGQIVGEFTTTDQVRHAFIYTAGRGIRELPAPSGASGAEAKAINNVGQVGGSAFFPDGTQHLMVWVVAGDQITLFDRGVPLGGRKANTEGITPNGTIAGTADDEAGRPIAHRTSPTGDINPLDRESDEVSSLATGINYRNSVVGYYRDQAGDRRPFLAANGDQIRALDLPPGCPEAVAYGIDRESRIVVTGIECNGKGSPDRTFIRSSSGGYTELFNGHTQARAMNDRGDVAGWRLIDAKNQAFVWTRSDGEDATIGLFPGGSLSQALGLSNGQ